MRVLVLLCLPTSALPLDLTESRHQLLEMSQTQMRDDQRLSLTCRGSVWIQVQSRRSQCDLVHITAIRALHVQHFMQETCCCVAKQVTDKTESCIPSSNRHEV